MHGVSRVALSNRILCDDENVLYLFCPHLPHVSWGNGVLILLSLILSNLNFNWNSHVWLVAFVLDTLEYWPTKDTRMVKSSHTHLFTYCLCLLLHCENRVELLQQILYGLQAKITAFWSLTEKVDDSWSRAFFQIQWPIIWVLFWR